VKGEAMAETIQARLGNNGALLADFDGRVLEIFGAVSGSTRWLASQLVIKRLKDSKDGGTNFRLLTGLGGGMPHELAFPPEYTAEGDQLIQALYAAGAQED
jgi:hypothetical protein